MTLLALLIILTSTTLPEVVEQAAISQGLDPAIAARIVTLESDWVVLAVGDNGESCGLMQFKAATWTEMVCQAGAPEWADPANRFDPVKAALVGCWGMANGYGSHWSTWQR